MTIIPNGLTLIAWLSLLFALISFVYLTVSVKKHPQNMAIMNIVWPLTALFGSVLWVMAYKKWGESNQKGKGMQMMSKPMAVSVFIGTCHCGAGCSLADLIIEWLLYFFPSLYILGGYGAIFSHKLFAGFVLAFVLALCIGVSFQYFAIKPMRHLTRKQGIIEAIKADTLSLSCWQIGMYATVAICQLWIFPKYLGGQVLPTTPVFWLMMQVAMLVGFCTAYPMNWWLIKKGIKEKM